MDLFAIISAVSSELLDAIFFDYRFLPLYIIVGLIVKARYNKYMDFERSIDGWKAKTGRLVLEEMIFTGLLAGFLISVATVCIGIFINLQTFQYILIIMVALALFNARYACMSYASGLLCIISLVFGIPAVDVTGILALTAVLHLLESVMIFINAGRDSIPVFIRTEEGIAGAFIIRKFWPLPVVFLTLVTQGGGNQTVGNMELLGQWVWWPMFGPEIVMPGVAALALDCVITALDYSDIAITRTPEHKSKDVALQLSCYSIMLFIISVLSTRIFVFKPVGAILALLGHEGIMLIGYYRERTGEPMFKPVRRGLRVLDVLPDSHAEKMGVQKGDVILSVNGKDIQTEDGLNEALKMYPTFIWVDVVDVYGNKKTYEYRCYPYGLNSLGLLTVPREREVTYNISYFENLAIISNLVARFKRANKPV